MKKCLRLISMIVAAITVSVSVSACNRSIIGYIINGSDGQSTSIDAAKMTNDITTDKIHALFTVVATNSKISGWGRIGGSARAQGSGVAFYKKERSLSCKGFISHMFTFHVSLLNSLSAGPGKLWC